ncbi:MAG: precorrin-4/cobalt-precorrin-4 C11-methyltransferase, partial [Burkholderiaceae bacterium]
MKVYFIGAGPGAPDLITLRGATILGRVSTVLYAGSLVPTAILVHCKPG